MWLSSVWLSCHIQHGLSAAAAAAVTAVVVAVAGLMAAEAVASMVAAGLMAADIAVVADIMAVEDIVVADMAARGLMVAEEVAPQACLKRAAIPARPERGRQEISRRIIIPQSTMASGIRSATPVVPLVPRV
ncbi:MAG TPA: hypothetical protein VK302_09225 [Terriglobales bacterium]|nr:hypothetical protein [Terriglobales bacterium]